jgi:hypothetical protein
MGQRSTAHTTDDACLKHFCMTGLLSKAILFGAVELRPQTHGWILEISSALQQARRFR